MASSHMADILAKTSDLSQCVDFLELLCCYSSAAEIMNISLATVRLTSRSFKQRTDVFVAVPSMAAVARKAPL